MAANLRSLRFESKDDAQRWRVFQAVEEVAREVAGRQGTTLAATMNVRHSGGEFHRDTVAEAMAMVDRNGFKPSEMWLYMERVPVDSSRPERALDPWVSVNLRSGFDHEIVVAAQGDNEVEVNGVFTLLEAAVDQAKKEPGAGVIGHIYLDTNAASAATAPHPTARPARARGWQGWLGDVSASAVGNVAGVLLIAAAGLLWALLH